MREIQYTSLYDGSGAVPRQYPWLAADESCEVAVIGGGISGCSAAYHLSAANINTILLSRRPIGFSSLLGSASLLAGLNEQLLIQLSKSIGKENAVLCLKLCMKALGDLEAFSKVAEDFAFRRRDAFLYTARQEDAGQLNAEYLMRKHNGFPVHFLDHSDTKEWFSFPVRAGILMEGMAGEVDGYRFCHALACKAAEGGGRIYENSGVVSIGKLEDGLILLTDQGRRVRAKKVVLAVGSKQLAYLPSTISRRKVFTLATSPVNRFTGYESRAVVRDFSEDFSFRTTEDNRLLASGLTSSLVPPANRLGKLLRPEHTAARKYEELRRGLEDRLVGMGALEAAYCCNGVYGTTRDGLPLIGEHTAYEDIYFDLPASPNGILFAYLAGQMLADSYQWGLADNIFSPNRANL